MVNAVSMDNVEHAYAVQQLRKSGKNAKIVSVVDIHASYCASMALVNVKSGSYVMDTGECD